MALDRAQDCGPVRSPDQVRADFVQRAKGATLVYAFSVFFFCFQKFLIHKLQVIQNLLINVVDLLLGLLEFFIMILQMLGISINIGNGLHQLIHHP